MLNVNRLRMLREVAARGSVAAAAEALYLTPSAVSQQMSVLEREAGVALLERYGRGVRLTDAGRRLVDRTELILAELERAEAELADSTVGLVGKVRLSAFPTAARTILIPTIAKLRTQYPNLRLSMVDLEPEESLPALKAGDLDVVVTYEWDLLPALEDPGIEREKLLVEPVYLAMPANHQLAKRASLHVADLSAEEWIVGRDTTSMLDLVLAAARREGFVPRTDFHSMDFQVILSAVGAGLGVALVPPLALFGEYPDVVVRELSGIEMNRSVWATIRRGSAEKPGIAAVMHELREQSRVASARLPTPERP